MHWIFTAMRNSANIALRNSHVTFNFEESKLVRFFTCVCICDSFALKFAHYLLDHIFDARHMKIKL